MMKRLMRIAAFLMMLVLVCPAFAATATPTPAPREIDPAVQQPPEEIRRFLDIAYGEWESLAGKTLSRTNKYTEWRGKGVACAMIDEALSVLVAQHVPYLRANCVRRNKSAMQMFRRAGFEWVRTDCILLGRDM